MQMAQMKKNAIHTLLLIGAMWIMFLLSYVLPLNKLGIAPRSLFGLIGIILSPFLHLNFNHILSNTSALIVFVPLFSLVESEGLLQKIGVLILISGFLTWLIAFGGIHIGASGLIFALYGYFLSLAYFKRKFPYILLSIGVTGFYGYMIFGVLPLNSCVSWEGHLSGLIGGIIYAKFTSR